MNHISLVLFQTCMAFFLPWNADGEVKMTDSFRYNESEQWLRLSITNIIPNDFFCVPGKKVSTGVGQLEVIRFVVNYLFNDVL